MDRIEVSAPGKLVLIGEYAVLFGAPAAVAAVDRRAVVTLRPATGDAWEVSSPGLAVRPAHFQIGADGTVRWHDEQLGQGTLGLVDAVLGEIEASGAVALAALAPLAMTLDTRAFFAPSGGGGAKLGLGSSAALTVALATGLEGWSADGQLPSPDLDRLQILVDLHRAVQGGQGSGIDVAASLLGGVLGFRLDGAGSVAEAAPLVLPEALRLVFAWTGRAASTGDFLARLKAGLAESSAEVQPALDELGEVASIGVAALCAGCGRDFLDAVDAFWGALDRLGKAIRVPILSDEHWALWRLAAESGVRYKPSGAGGGDFGIGFADEPMAAVDFAERVAAAGFCTLDLHVEPRGVAKMGP